MISSEDRSPTQRIARLLADRARRSGIPETRLCEHAKLSKSYLSKAKSGGVREIPQEKLRKLAEIVGLQPKRIFKLLDLEEPSWLATDIGSNVVRKRSSIRLRFPYIATVPDHLWPLLVRDLFEEQDIELIPEPVTLSEFRSRMKTIEKGECDTICVLNSEWLKNEQWQIESRIRPIYITHLYHGYSLVGRDYSKENYSRFHGQYLRGLDVSPTLRNLFVMLAEMRYSNTLGEEGTGSGTIAYCDSGGLEFVEKLIELAKLDGRTKGMFADIRLQKIQPYPSPTLTFLEPLAEFGDRHYNFVVGHALTTAKALELPHFRVFANFQNLEHLVDNLESMSANGSPELELESLKKPVVLGMNIPNDWKKIPEVKEACLRICRVVNHAVGRRFQPLGERALHDMEDILSTREETQVGSKQLRDAWDTSYKFLSLDDAIGRASTDELAPAREVMDMLNADDSTNTEYADSTGERNELTKD